jgi:peroxiredoxin-like protein
MSQGSKTATKHKTYTYSAKTKWSGNREGTATSEGLPGLQFASPPEFKGTKGRWSPETLFVAALDACTMLTFLSFADRKEVEVVSYESQAEGTLEFVDGSFRFTKVTLKPRIVVKGDDAVGTAEDLVERAHDKCLIANSTTADVTVDATVESDG